MKTSALTLLAVAFLIVLSSCISCAGVIYVRGNLLGSVSDGKTWDTAYRTIATAMTYAAAGDEIRVAAATYPERVSLKNGVKLFGGFPANGGLWELRNPSANTAVIDGQQGGSTVTIITGTASGTTIDGFTIQNGKATNGGGIQCSSGPLATITNNTIRQNSASSYGGGINGLAVITRNRIMNNSAPYGAAINGGGTITHNEITGNSGSYGGAVRVQSINVLISDNRISGNTGVVGGAIWLSGTSSTVERNIITLNKASSGGGVYASGGTPVVANNIISSNTSVGNGGGICCDRSAVSVVNNTVTDNTAANGGGIAVQGICSPQISNSIFAFNSSGVYKDATSTPLLSHNDVYGNTTYQYSADFSGEGDISQDPMLYDRSVGDYHLQESSPCKDAGDDSFVQQGWVDVDGQPRIFGPHVDMGALEFRPPLVSNVKAGRNGNWAAVGGIVTASWPDCFYLEASDRSCGVRVVKAGYAAVIGQKAAASGIIKTSVNSEKYLEASVVIPDGEGNIQPVEMSNWWIGGGDMSYDPVTGAGQKGIERYYRKTGWASCGLNNIGLLVKTAGRVCVRGRDWFYIDDGSGVKDGTPYTGIYIECPGVTPPAAGSFAAVTGISSCEYYGGRLANVLRSRLPADITVLVPAPAQSAAAGTEDIENPRK